ncbi:MAG TPA: hypothetical protein VMA36_10695 [Candidatus Limnocylindria bacterium]|nr:hypothetical protein [Candidatus Limnocylindria bacterium]
MVGAIACVSVLGFYAVLKESEFYQEERRRRAAERWMLPRRKRRRRSPEDDCRHCVGTGVCEECAPTPCRLCQGTGIQPRDEALVSRLTALWDGA